MPTLTEQLGTLTTSVDSLTSAVNVQKATLDAAVASAAASANTAVNAITPSTGPAIFNQRNGATGPLTYTYDGSNRITQSVETLNGVTITTNYVYSGSQLTQLNATVGSQTWRQTLTYDGSGNLSSRSAWVLL